MYRLSLLTFNLSARSFNCRFDSSPDTYKILLFLPIYSQIWSRIVDLPIPGSPPKSTRLPFTIPPPRTRSSSDKPVLYLISSVVEISLICTGGA